MISLIYIPTVTILVKYYEDRPFNEFVVESFPSCIEAHLPESVSFMSIEYRQDNFIHAFLEFQLSDNLQALQELKSKGAEIEIGYFLIQLEGDDNLEKTRLPYIEFVLQQLHEEYSFISSYHLYVEEEGVRIFCKMHTFESEADDDDTVKDLDDYANLFEGYFYHQEIPDAYSDEIAKIMLIQGQL